MEKSDLMELRNSITVRRNPTTVWQNALIWIKGKGKRKVGGKRYEARSHGRSSPDTLAFCACVTPRR